MHLGVWLQIDFIKVRFVYKKKIEVITGKFKQQYLLWETTQFRGNYFVIRKTNLHSNLQSATYCPCDLLTFLDYGFLHSSMGRPYRVLGKITFKFIHILHAHRFSKHII